MHDRTGSPMADREVCARAWVMSDLQTSSAAEARRCLRHAIGDVESLGLSVDQLWYLGDAVSGTDLERNRAVAETQIEMLADVGVPCRYVMGNHDIDPPRKADEPEMPFYDRVRDHPDWRTTDEPADFYFVDEIGEHTVLFLSDHVGPDLDWCVTHGRIRGDEDAYPYDEDDYRTAIEEAAATDRPLITAGHNAFAGGNRAAGIQDWLMPLPLRTVLHCYGHAHIGDVKRMPSADGRNGYQTLSYVDHHQVPQIDVASLEDRRGDVIRSAILETYVDGGVAIHVRDHSNKTWRESYMNHGWQYPYVTSFSDGRAIRTAHLHEHLQLAVEHFVAEYGLSLADPPAIDGLEVASDPEAVRQAVEVSDGYVIDGGLGKGTARQLLAGLAEQYGVSADFDGIFRQVDGA